MELHSTDIDNRSETPFGKNIDKDSNSRGSSNTESSELMYASPEIECFSTIGMNFDFMSLTTRSKISVKFLV